MSYEGHRAILVLGGIRSGKSEYAESLVSTAAGVRYVATAAPSDGDPAWAARLAAHRARRPESWQTEEIGTDLTEIGAAQSRLAELIANAKPDQTLLIDDLGGWLASLLADPGAVPDAVTRLVAAVRDTAARVILVSPEVGLSVHPPTEAGLAFADALGSANQALAGVCDAVVLVVAGQPIRLKRGVPGSRLIPLAARPAPAATRATVATTVLPALDLTGSSVPALDLTGTGVPVVEAGLSLPIPDQEMSVAATERLRDLDVPGPGLGRLAEVIAFAGGTQASADPRPYQAVRVLLLSGVHEGGVAAGDDPAEWARQLEQMTAGGGPLGLLAGQAGASLQLADLAMAGLPAAAAVEDGDAVPAEQVEVALRYGWRLAESAVDSGTDLVVLAAGGPGQEAAAVAVIAATTHTEAAKLLPRVRRPGGRFDDLAWMARCAAIRDALHRSRGRAPKEILATIGGADLAVAVGVLLGAAARRTPVLIDGPVGVAAGLVARDLTAQARLWLLLADHGGHPATRTGAETLSLTPVVELGLRLGEGAGALAALPLIQSALLLSATAGQATTAGLSATAGPAIVPSTVDSDTDPTGLADPETIRA